MNRINHIVLFCLLMTVALTACIKESLSGIVTPDDPDSRVVRMHIRVPGNPTVASRAFADTYIQTIDVLSFREDDGTFRYRSSASVIDAASEWFDVTLSKSNDEQQVLVVLANLKSELDALTLTPGSTTLDQLRSSLTLNFVHQTTYDATHSPASKVSGQYGTDRPLPMWGEYGPVSIVDELVNLGTIYMLRSLAAVTVLINLDMSDPEQKPFQLVDVAIYNTVDKGLAIPDPDGLEITSSSVKALEPSVPAGVLYDKAYYESTDGTTIAGGIYIGERSNTAPGIVEEDRTWLLVAGRYDNSTDVTWYRLPFIDRDGKQWDILRNHNYIFNIYKVSGPGGGEEDAKDADIYADVIPWNEGADEIFDIQGQYWIWIDPTSASYDILGGTDYITVETNYPGGCTATVSGSETDLSVACPWLTADVSPTDKKLNYTVAPTDEWEHRVGYIHIRAADFAVTVRIDQSQLYLESINVTPTGDLSGDGDTRVIRGTGLFDDIQVQVWDVTNNAEITQLPANSFIAGNYTTGNPSSVTVTIPAWTQDTPRTIEFRYYNKRINAWVAITQAKQEGYDFAVASTLGNNSTIDTRNATYQINVSGTSWPVLYARAVVQGTQTVVGGPITIPAGSGPNAQQSITIGEYQQWKDQPARVVELQWSRSNTDWTGATTLNYGNQKGDFEITGSSAADPAVENGENKTIRVILPNGGNLSVTVDGSYLSGWVQVRAVTSNKATEVSVSNPNITDISTKTVAVPIKTNYNYSGTYGTNQGHRDVICQYRRYINGVAEAWQDVNMTEVKQLGYVTLSTGRVVAIEDLKSNKYPDYPDHFVWADAMGIDSKYDTQGYPEAGLAQTSTYTSADVRAPVPNYSLDYHRDNGGCAAYTEDGTLENFYLPTQAEILEMRSRFKELGKIAYAEEWNYWCNREYYDTQFGFGWMAFNFDLEYDSQTSSARDRNRLILGVVTPVLRRARCVRAP